MKIGQTFRTGLINQLIPLSKTSGHPCQLLRYNTSLPKPEMNSNPPSQRQFRVTSIAALRPLGRNCLKPTWPISTWRPPGPKKRYDRRLGNRARPDTADRAIDKLKRDGFRNPVRWELPKKPAKKTKLAPAAHVEHTNRFAALDGVLEGNPNPAGEPEGETSEQPGPFRIPAEPLPQRTPLRQKRQAAHSPEVEGDSAEEQTAMDDLPDDQTALTWADSDGKAESPPRGSDSTVPARG